MKRFVNRPDAVVREAIDGLLLSSAGGALTRIDDFPDIKVVLRADWTRAQVAVVSGGGSGHEPSHAGFVGAGMLTAAVCGEVFASPSVDAVLAAILAVTGPAGCLLIVTNYTGDRLNFGLAAERARAMGLAVEMVIVGDDIALSQDTEAPNIQARGISGTVFVHKLAGAAAASGQDLAAVAAAASDAAAHVRSIGLSLSSGHGFSSEPNERLGPGEAEIGLGIHGEPGAAVVPAGPARAMMALAVEKLLAERHRPEARYAVLLNNLGAVPPIEMAVLTHALAGSPLAAQIDYVAGPALFMTSLNMNGFSLSLLELDAARTQALLADAAPVPWQKPRRFGMPKLVPAPALGGLEMAPASSDPAVRRLMEAAALLFASIEAEINALDARVGDGDTGSTFATAAAGVKQHLDRLPYAAGDKLLGAIGALLQRQAGGSSGVLLATFFTAAGANYARDHRWIPAFGAGLARMKQYGGARLGDRTLIDALEPALQALADGGTLRDAAARARQGADATRAMPRARAGRAAYVPEASLLGVTDPGAEAIARLFECLAGDAPDAPG